MGSACEIMGSAFEIMGRALEIIGAAALKALAAKGASAPTAFVANGASSEAMPGRNPTGLPSPSYKTWPYCCGGSPHVSP